MTQIMQPEFSAAISGVKSPEEALREIEKGIKKVIQQYD
jgi:ABC-type glycerol-3-phosphate transport system substrate-binding protein